MDTATNLACEVDGRPIPNLGSFRVQSPAFDITFPEGSVFQEWCGVLPGTYGPFVSDGYWLMLAPLPTGQHTIHFHGVIPGIFTLDITYHLTVTDRDRYFRVAGSHGHVRVAVAPSAGPASATTARAGTSASRMGTT
jgi:hypothetical protein